MCEFPSSRPTAANESPGRRLLKRSLLNFALSAALAFGTETIGSSAPLRVRTDQVRAVFEPSEAFGVAIDGGSPAEAASLLNSANARPVGAAGFARASYRLRTELAGEVWHWSQYGNWSDPAGQQGYWIGDSSKDDDRQTSFGYRLPRRGNSRDEADDDGFSRIDDGDVASYWKSNPYLDPRLDGLGSDAQWIIVDLGVVRRLDTVKIFWAEPHAARFRLQSWVGTDPYDGRWRDLTSSIPGHPGLQQLTFRSGVARYVRLLLERSSHSALPGSKDSRDLMGYAVGELELGLTANHEFRDFIRHEPVGRRQTQIRVSSTDPWHREIDRDPELVQPSPLALYERSLFRGPFMLPLGLVTDTPDNALAELHYFLRRGLPIDGLEIGEEPEGQSIPPAMAAELYRRLASRISAQVPNLPIGGPSLIDPIADTMLDDEHPSWTREFLQALKEAQPATRIAFISTELYPVEDLCASGPQMLAQAARAPRAMAARFHDDGADDLPGVITEFGLSPYGGRALNGLVAALADAEILAGSLSHGVKGLYLYGSSPTSAVGGERACAGRGNLTLWNSARDGQIVGPSLRLQAFQ